MTFIEVAEKVLRSSKRPMKPEEIVAIATDKGWLYADTIGRLMVF